MRKHVREILSIRDNISIEEADAQFRSTLRTIIDIIDNKGGLEEIEEVIMNDLGLKPDFVEDFLDEIVS